MTLTSNNSVSVAVEFFVEGFEAAWEADLLPTIEAFVPPIDHPAYQKALVELACIDLERRWGRGTRPDLATYFTRFPALVADRESRRQLAFEDYRQRLQRGEAPPLEEYHARFGVDTADWPAPEDRSRTPMAAPREDLLRTRIAVPRPLSGMSPPPSHPSRLATHVGRAKVRMPKVGDDFLGFHLLHHLGSGAFGSVFLCNQSELAGRLVALKVSANLGDESQRLAQLQHTNIMPIYSAHRAGDLDALCMPYFGGVTVADLCRSLTGDAGLPTSGRHIISTMQDRQGSIPSRIDLRK